MSRPQVWPRACTSAPPSLNFPSLTGANPSFLAKSATGAIASSSSLDRKTTRWPPPTIGSVASVAATKWLKPFTNLAPVNDFATNAEDGRPSSSSGGTGNEFIASMTVLLFQLGRAFAISRCSPNGTAKMIVSASSASRSDLATTVDPIARACGANASGGAATRNGHVDVFTGEGVGEGLTYLSESYNCIAHNVSPIRVDIDSQPSTARDIKFRSVAIFSKRPAVNHFAGRRKVNRQQR